MRKIYICLILVVIILFVIPTLLFSIASITIGLLNIGIHCKNEIMNLSAWLIVNGSVSLVMLSLLKYLVKKFFKNHNMAWALCILIFIVIYGFFTLSWSLIGSLTLFDKDVDCKKKVDSVQYMVFFTLIFQWISIFYSCCYFTIKRKIEQEDHIENETLLVDDTE